MIYIFYKILLIFLFTSNVYSFSQLIDSCENELPLDKSSYEYFLNCKSKGAYDGFYIGDVISIGEKNIDKKKSLSDLSESIRIYIESSFSETFYRDEVSYNSDGENIEQYNLEHYLVTTLKTESNNYIKQPIFRELITNSGIIHLVTFKSKKKNFLMKVMKLIMKF